MGHHVIRPVERDCICPTRPPVAHSPQCEEAFRSKFFDAWERERERFYGTGGMPRAHQEAPASALGRGWSGSSAPQ